MVKRFNIGKLNVSFVFRHRFEKSEKSFDKTFDAWKISFWFKTYQIVGKANFKDVKKWNDNLVTDYMLGCELLLFKAWIDVDFGGMHINEK